MYYHVLIEKKEKHPNSSIHVAMYELDRQDLTEIEKDILLPYLNNATFEFDGRFISKGDIERVKVFSSKLETENYAFMEMERSKANRVATHVSKSDILYYDEHVSDITKDTLKRVLQKVTTTENPTDGVKQAIPANRSYYQIHVELKDPFLYAKLVGSLTELDITDLAIIENDIIMPYLRNKQFHVNGSVLTSDKVKKISVMKSSATVDTNMNAEIAANHTAAIYLEKTTIIFDEKYYQNITREVFASVQRKIDNGTAIKTPNKTVTPMDVESVFIVHGHDTLAKTEVARFIERLGLKPIILHEQASSGKTIIEKIEAHSNVGFGIVLYTPCDIGAVKTDSGNLQPRARQNVVFEHGFLIGKLGRDKVCALVKETVEKPNDISGVVYVQMDEHHAWHLKLAKEMKAAGYPVDMNKL